MRFSARRALPSVSSKSSIDGPPRSGGAGLHGPAAADFGAAFGGVVLVGAGAAFSDADGVAARLSALQPQHANRHPQIASAKSAFLAAELTFFPSTPRRRSRNRNADLDQTSRVGSAVETCHGSSDLDYLLSTEDAAWRPRRRPLAQVPRSAYRILDQIRPGFESITISIIISSSSI